MGSTNWWVLRCFSVLCGTWDTHLRSSRWFQPIRKISVNLDHFPRHVFKLNDYLWWYMRVSNQGSPPHNFQGNHHLACTQSSCEPRFRLRNRKLLRQLIPLRYSCCCAWASTWRIPSEASHAWGPTGIDTGTRRCHTSGTCPTWGSVGLLPPPDLSRMPPNVLESMPSDRTDCTSWQKYLLRHGSSTPRRLVVQDQLGSNDFLGHWQPILRSVHRLAVLKLRAPHFTMGGKHVFLLTVCCPPQKNHLQPPMVFNGYTPETLKNDSNKNTS